MKKDDGEGRGEGMRRGRYQLLSLLERRVYTRESHPHTSRILEASRFLIGLLSRGESASSPERRVAQRMCKYTLYLIRALRGRGMRI